MKKILLVIATIALLASCKKEMLNNPTGELILLYGTSSDEAAFHYTETQPVKVAWDIYIRSGALEYISILAYRADTVYLTGGCGPCAVTMDKLDFDERKISINGSVTLDGARWNVPDETYTINYNGKF